MRVKQLAAALCVALFAVSAGAQQPFFSLDDGSVWVPALSKSLKQAIADGDLGAGAGAILRIVADCSAETGGVQDELCIETADESLWYCSTATCEGAGWVLTGGGTGDAPLPVCEYWENPNPSGEQYNGFFGHFFEARTVLEMWCRVEGGTSCEFRLEEDADGTETTISTGVTFTCGNSAAGSSDDFTDEVIGAGNEIDGEIVSCTAGVNTVQVCIRFQ